MLEWGLRAVKSGQDRLLSGSLAESELLFLALTLAQVVTNAHLDELRHGV